MVDTVTKIMTEVLDIIGIATKEIKQGRTSKSFPYEDVPVHRAIFREISKVTVR